MPAASRAAGYLTVAQSLCRAGQQLRLAGKALADQCANIFLDGIGCNLVAVRLCSGQAGSVPLAEIGIQIHGYCVRWVQVVQGIIESRGVSLET